MEVKRIIKDDSVEYMVELTLNDHFSYSLVVNFYRRDKGKRKWNAFPFSYKEKEKIKELWGYSKRKERNKLFLSLIKKTIPNITELLQEMQKELAEEVKKQILKIKL